MSKIHPVSLCFLRLLCWNLINCPLFFSRKGTLPSSLIQVASPTCLRQHELLYSDFTKYIFPNSDLWPKSSRPHVGHFFEWSRQLLMLKHKNIGPQSAIKWTSDPRDLCVLHFSTWIPMLPACYPKQEITFQGNCLQSWRQCFENEGRIQMFRNYSGDFYRWVVYKFKTKNIASKDAACPILKNCIFLSLFVVLFTKF